MEEFLTDGDEQVSPEHEAHQPLGLRGHDHGEAAVASALHQRLGTNTTLNKPLAPGGGGGA